MPSLTNTLRAHYRWIIVAAGGLLGCVAIGALFSLPVLLRPIALDTGWSTTGISAAMTFAFAAMAVGSMGWGALSDRIGPRLVILAGSVLLTLGLALSENRKPHEAVVHRQEFTGKAAPYLNFFIERYAEAFSAEIDEFVAAVEGKRAPEVGFDDGRIALLLAEAAIKSATEGRVVRLTEMG